MLLQVIFHTPQEQQKYEGIQSISALAVSGEMTILYHHEPMMVQLQTGLLTLRPEKGQYLHFFIQAGLLRTDGTHVHVTSIEILSTHSLTVHGLEKAIQASEGRLEKAISESEQQALFRDKTILEAKLEILKMLQGQ